MARTARQLPQVADRFMDLDRFRSLVKHNPDSGCLEWQGSLNNAGYGLFGYRNAEGRGRMMTAHRAAWMIHNDTTIPQDLQVQHTCHNRRCCTPEHLITGDHQEKMKALMMDHRHGFQINPASHFPRDNWHLHYDARRKYSREEIQWIRAATHEEIAERYGVTYQRAERMRSLMRSGYRWLPYDRKGTRLKTGKKAKSLDSTDPDPV